MTGNRSDRLRAMLAGDEDPAQLEIQVRASGGAPTERYDLNLTASGTGEVSGRLRDALTSRDHTLQRRLGPAGRDELFRRLLATGLLDGPRIQPPFEADTVVARIRATVNREPVDEWYALIDPRPNGEEVAAEVGGAQQALHVLLELLNT